MKLEGRLATNIDAMSQYQARDTLAELNKAFAGKRGRIVFQKDAHGNLTGATRDRGFWSGIKAVVSSSYRERLQATEREFGALCAKAAGQSVDGALIIDGLRRDRRLQERADPVAAHFREYGISNQGGVAGQLTPGLMEHAARGFDFSDKTPIERIEHGLELNGLSMERLHESAERNGLSADQAKALYGQVIEQQKKIDELRKIDPEGSAWLEKTPRQCAKELVDSLCAPRVDVGEVLIKLADFHARIDGFCQTSIDRTNNTLNTDVLQDPIDHALDSLSKKDRQRLYENIQASYELCALAPLGGIAVLDNAVADIVAKNKGCDLHEDRDNAASAAKITSGLVAHLGQMMCHLNGRVCEALGKSNPIGDLNNLTQENFDFLASFQPNLGFDSEIPNGKAIWATIQLTTVNGGSLRKAVEAYKNGANTPEAVARQFDEASTWGSGDTVGETFSPNFGYILENTAGREGKAVDRFLHEMRVFKPPIDGRQVFAFENSALENYKLEAAQWDELGASEDQGGHGGTLKGKLTLKNGQEAEVFLKPFDGVEAKNYELIARMTDGKLDAFLPKIHGRVTDSRGKQFLIMENTLHGQRKQFGDIKIAGKVRGLDNPIADQDEMVFTRGKKKSSLNFWQMNHDAAAAPDFMFAKDMPVLGKAGRFFNYQHSENSLRVALREADLTAEGLHRLAGRIRELNNLLSESPVALIGGSVMIIRNEDGEAIPMLIDPAHVQYDPALKDRFGDCGAFYGEPDKFELRKASGRLGLEALEQSIERLANRM